MVMVVQMRQTPAGESHSTLDPGNFKQNDSHLAQLLLQQLLEILSDIVSI